MGGGGKEGSYFLDNFYSFLKSQNLGYFWSPALKTPFALFWIRGKNQTHSISLASVKTKYELIISHYPAFMGNSKREIGVLIQEKLVYLLLWPLS